MPGASISKKHSRERPAPLGTADKGLHLTGGGRDVQGLLDHPKPSSNSFRRALDDWLSVLTECPGPPKRLAQLVGAASCPAVDHFAVLDDSRDSLWTLQHCGVGDPLEIPRAM